MAAPRHRADELAAEGSSTARLPGRCGAAYCWAFCATGTCCPRQRIPPARLANCDDLRPLEQDNCLWDILLLHKYVAFTVQPPYAPKALECAALHALLDPERNPAQDKTVAEFLGVSRAAVSQRRKTWQQKLVQMKAEQEDG